MWSEAAATYINFNAGVTSVYDKINYEDKTKKNSENRPKIVKKKITQNWAT